VKPDPAHSSHGTRLHTLAATETRPAPAFLGRQPIFDRALAVYGYELLYRRGNETQAHIIDFDSASARTAVDAFLDFGLDTLVADRSAFINLTRAVLLSGVCRQLPADRVVLELLETLPCDEEVAREVVALAAAGYRIALDDFVPGDLRAPLLPHAAIVKIDIEAVTDSHLQELTARLRPLPVELVAERVETQEQLDLCRDLGVGYFQGFFFARPTILQGRRVPVERLTALRVLALLADPDASLHSLSEAIAGDVKLSYQLLRAANSAFSSPAAPIESIDDAIMRLGRNQLRAWLCVMAMSGLDGKPLAVLSLALTRARMCEALGQAAGAASPGTWFMAGLFSTLDILFNAPLKTLLDALPLSPSVVDAIENRSGALGESLNAVVAFERGEWHAARSGRLTPDHFTQAFREALEWTRDWQRYLTTGEKSG
jgi:EAL and modified HD-GYP domain-containing signal transduction protein